MAVLRLQDVLSVALHLGCLRKLVLGDVPATQQRWASWSGFLQKVHVMMALGFEYCTSIDGLCSEHSSSIGDLGSEHSSSINGCGHSPSICDLGSEHCSSIDGLGFEHSSSIDGLGSEHSSSIDGCGHSPSIGVLQFLISPLK